MQSRNKNITVGFGIFMVLLIALSAILPAFSNQQRATSATTAPRPTQAPAPTLPPPITDFSGITFEQEFLHPTGLFSIGVPTGWTPSQPVTQSDRVDINLINPTVQSTIQTYVQIPAEPITTLEGVDALFTAEALDASWSRYGDWSETQRREEGDKLLIDFNLTLNRVNYIARHIAWSDGEWVYVVRVITPENAPELLRYLLDNEIPTLTPHKQFASTPTEWQVYFDQPTTSIIRYPGDWLVADSAPGRVTVITSTVGDPVTVRLSNESGAAADEDAARAWLENAVPGAEILSVAPVTRGENNGFSVAYSTTNIDGDRESGLAVLLNSGETLNSANLRFIASGTDLNAPGENSAYQYLADVMSSFSLLPGVDLPEPTPSPTLVPTVAP